MEIKNATQLSSDAAVAALSALAQDHRLAVFRLLVQAGQGGMAAGVIAERLDLPASSLSFHLSHLKQGGMVNDEREGRSIIYRADFEAMNGLLSYLMENCCQGDNCAPLAAETVTEKE